MDSKRLKVRVSGDRLTAKVDVRKGDAQPPELAAQTLADAGVVAGLDLSAVAAIAGLLEDPEGECSMRVVATGRAPVAGRDGALTLRFELGIRPGRLREDGSLDYFDRCLLQPVRVGEAVADYDPPTLGVPGEGVDGSARKARDGRERLPRLGAGVAMGPDFILRAQVDGVVHSVPNKLLDVVAKHEHKGEVDLHSGHLDTPGSLVVTGAVHTRLTVRAGASVEVRREVHCASVFAGGDVIVGGGIVGGEAGHVVAEGDVTARFLQVATVDCGGTIRISHDVVSSTLQAAALEVGGRLIGGRVSVQRSVVANEVGTTREQVTRLMVGARGRLEETEEEKSAVAKSVALGLGSVRAPAPEEAGSDPTAPDALEETPQAFVEARLVHPGTRIFIHGRVYVVKKTLRDVRFVYDATRDAVDLVALSCSKRAAS